MLDTDDGSTESTAQDDSPEYASEINSKGDSIRPSLDKFEALVEDAATWQLHSSNDPRAPRPPPAAEHYVSFSGSDPRLGDIYRIWKEDNSVMHLQTVVLLVAKGRSWQACKIKRCSENDLKTKRFYSFHSKVSENEPTGTATQTSLRTRASSRLEPVKVIMNEDQGLASDAWVDLDPSFHVGGPDDYQVVYCGKLSTKSREYAVEKHKELY